MARSEVQGVGSMPVAYAISDMNDLLKLIAEKRVTIHGGWPTADGYVVLAAPHAQDLDEIVDELIQKTVAQQRAKLDTYLALKDGGLPVPFDLKAEIEANGLGDKNGED